MFQETELKQNMFKLGHYYKKHRAFYGLTVQKTIELEGYSSALKKLSIRWAENKTACSVDTEVAELTGLTEGLSSLSGSFEAIRSWLRDLEGASTNALCFSLKNAELNDLLLDWTVCLNVEEQAFQNFLFIANSLRKAVGLLNADPLSAQTEGDFSKQRFVSRRLLIASGMVNESASIATMAVGLVQSNERRWQDLPN